MGVKVRRNLVVAGKWGDRNHKRKNSSFLSTDTVMRTYTGRLFLSVVTLFVLTVCCPAQSKIAAVDTCLAYHSDPGFKAAEK